MPSGHETESSSPASRRHVAPTLVLTGLLLLGLLGARPARGDAAAGAIAAFQTAWTGRSAAGVVGQLPARGQLRLGLFTPSVSGTFHRAQAERTLKSYFEAVSGIVLKDVTSVRHRDPPGFRVRTYNYTYLPKGRDQAATRLVVTFKAAGENRWELDEISERVRPRR